MRVHSDETQLKELLNKEAARTAQIELIVTRSEIISYAYKSRTVKSEYVYTQKLQTVLLSRIGEQYCLGVAKLKRKDAAELKLSLIHISEPTRRTPIS